MEDGEQLVALRELKIVGCDKVQLLPEGLGQLKKLQSLGIDHLEVLTCLPDSLGQLESLERLEILNLQNLQSLPVGLGELKKLKSLKISNAKALTCLPDSLGQLESLERLEILDSKNLQSLPEGLGELKKLKSLEISDAEALIRLPNSLAQLESLEQLDIWGLKELESLPEGLERLKKLKSLKISNAALAPEAVFPSDSRPDHRPITRYLGTDNATLNRTRATGARICVEVDLTVEPVKGFPIVVSPTKCIWQEARYEKPGFYCMKCHRQGHTAVVCRIGERLVFEGKPKEKSKTWQPKNMKTRREASGTKVGLETEENTVLPNAILPIIPKESNFQQNNVVIEGTRDEDLFTPVAMIETESIQGLKNCADNQLEDSDKECEEVCCDEDLEVVPETAQTWTYVEKSPLSSRTPFLGKQIGELASGSYSDQEEGEITELKGKGRAYDSDGNVHSELGKKFNGDGIVRRSKRVPTRSQKLNL
ncbi:hypothetical protein ACLOJK_037845 [Asimina triloba]